MYMPPKDAIKLIKSALAPRTAPARLKAAAKVIASMKRIASAPDLPWEAFVEQYLRDCLETKQHAKALVFLADPHFSADQMKKLLDVAVVLYVRLKKTRLALDWIETVSYVSGPKAVARLAKNPELAALVKTKSFGKLSGPDARRHIFDSDLAEIVSMWDSDEYDNFKDALQDARSLASDAAKLGPTRVKAAQKHLKKVEREIKTLMRQEPELREYLEGLL